jgi:hypothetical protein
MPDDQPYRLGNRKYVIYGAATAVFTALLLLPAVVVAAVLTRVVAGRVKRSEALLVFVASVVCMALVPRMMLVEPTVWFAALVFPWWDAGSVPFAGIAVQAFFLAGLWLLVTETAMWGKVMSRSSSVSRMFKSPFAPDSIIPDASAKERVRLAPMPMSSTPSNRRADPQSAPAAPPGKRQISISVDRNLRPVLIGEHELTMHAMILGSTGSGKTETIKSLAGALADLGYPVLLLDMKEDTAPGGLRDFAKVYAQRNAQHFQEMSLSDVEPSYWFNPFLGMGPDEAREVVLSLTSFDDEHWQNINKKLLGQLVNLLYDAHEADGSLVPYPTIFEVGKILSQPNLATATKKLRGVVATRSPGQYDEERYSALSSPTQEEQKTASGFGAKLTQMFATRAGRTILQPGTPGSRSPLDVTEPGITYVGLSALAQRDLATMVSSAVLQRMSVYAAYRASGRVERGQQRVVIIDEANVINRPIVKNLLARARSAGVTMVLCTQSPEDWIDEKGDDWSTMANNINVAMIMSQGSPKSAELCADFIGEKRQLQITQTAELGEMGARQSMRQALDYIVAPHELRGMSIGEMILRIGKPAERVVWSTVKQRDPSSTPAPRRLTD